MFSRNCFSNATTVNGEVRPAAARISRGYLFPASALAGRPQPGIVAEICARSTISGAGRWHSVCTITLPSYPHDGRGPSSALHGKELTVALLGKKQGMGWSMTANTCSWGKGVGAKRGFSSCPVQAADGRPQPKVALSRPGEPGTTGFRCGGPKGCASNCAKCAFKRLCSVSPGRQRP